MKKIGLIIEAFLLLAVVTIMSAQPANPIPFESQASPLSIDMQWFLFYQNGERDEQAFNEFALKRGYVNIKKTINPTFSGRITTDITVDREGDGEGDVEMRLKYLYLKTALPEFEWLNDPHIEVGLVHRPWLDFEQHINRYRVQGTMFLERIGVINSGDFGMVLLANIGGEVDEEYQKTVNSSFAGKYGSMAFGIFNGGGYHALEKNANKTVEGRLTLRPLPEKLPGLQVTGHGAVGKGNTAAAPDWRYGSAYLSYENPAVIVTGEFYRGLGNYKGTALKDALTVKALPQSGYSLFGEWKELMDGRISIIVRYDHVTRQYTISDRSTNRMITGLAYHFIRGSKIVLDYDVIRYDESGRADDHVLEAAIELKY
ncbi:MAG: hypothetical protein GF313_00375 [Caldithrix sp.]|nr:hypothetical protein [Caldithrix sp.]